MIPALDFYKASLREVDMVVYMVAAEAVIALALGAVTELKLRMVDIRPTADGTFMRIELVLLLAPDARGLLPEVDGVFARTARQ